MKKILAIGIVALLMCSVGIGMVIANTKDTDVKANGIEFTKEELQDLYRKYNVTENDIKFAMNELPYYLEGTILDSDTRVIASDTGEPPEGLKEGEDYDVVISTEKMFAIIEDARERYIEKYDVDPANPKVDSVDSVPLPKEEVERLVKNGNIKGLGHVEPLAGIRGGPHEGPHAIGELIVAHIFVATDDRHHPTQGITGDTHDALYRFETEFGVGMNVYWYWNSWDASDVSPADSTSKALGDLKGDVSWVRDADNDIVIGWLHDMDNNGRAYLDGFYAVCSDTASGYDWPHDSIVQHETSHLFNAPEGGFWCYEHPECIMNYCWAALHGTDIWCSSCREIVNENIWGD
jgi:hypothetical protein